MRFVDAINNIKTEILDLRDGDDDACRPLIKIWAEHETARLPEAVGVSIGQLMGQQRRFVELSISEARELAEKLGKIADQIESAKTLVSP